MPMRSHRRLGIVLGALGMLCLGATCALAVTNERRCAGDLVAGLRRAARSAGRDARACLGDGSLETCVPADILPRTAVQVGRGCYGNGVAGRSADAASAHVAGAK